MKLSVCMIVKNEIETLPEALASVVDHVDEIVVVDTGSTDGTQFLVKNYPKVVYGEFEWIDDFSAARNYAMSLASGEWIMTLDADDRVHQDDWPIIDDVIAQGQCDCVMFEINNVYEGGVVRSRHSQQRMFRRSLKPRYVGSVHNQLTFDEIPPDKLMTMFTPVRVLHVGYGLISDEKLAAKIARAKQMCEKFVQENPEDAFAWMNYGMALRNDAITPEENERVFECFSNVVRFALPGQLHLKTTALQLLGWCRYYQKRYEEAIEWGKQALEYKRDYLDAILLMAFAWADSGNVDAAEWWCKRYIMIADRYSYERYSDMVVQERVDQKSMVYQTLASIEEYKKKHRPAVKA